MRTLPSLGVGLALACAAAWTASPAAADYSVRFDARLLPTERSAHVEIRVRQADQELKSLDFRIDPERHRSFSGDGNVDESDQTVTWKPPKTGGTLRYVFRIDHLRDGRSYDARCASEWALFRGDDLVPPARVVTREGARSRSRLRLQLPDGWSAVTPYPRDDAGVHRVENPDRRFDRPTGWILAARRLGVAREEVSGVQLALAGPVGQDVRRLDTLALLRWTLPEIRKLLPRLPERLLVVGAGDPMWRGGLSGPNSIYLHAERPLITPDGSSPVLHEVMHVLFARGMEGSEDWLVEGLAEYYSLAVLQRSKTIANRRYERSLARMAERGASVPTVRTRRSEGEITARAVTLLTELDARIRDHTEGERDLDDVLRALVAADVPLALDPLRAAVEQVAGETFEDFFERRVFRAQKS